MRSGLTWSFGSNILSRITTLITGVILARLLSPQDFGEFAVALVAMTVLVNINDLGVEQCLVRWPGSIASIARTGNTVIFTFSAALCGLCLAGAGPFAMALGAPSATGMVQVLSIGILFNGAFAVPSAILTREFRQDKRTIADLVGFFVGTILTMVLAILGAGAWSLVWGRVIGNATVSVLHFWFTPKRYGFGWDPGLARSLIRSSLPLGGATVVAVALLNVDYVIVGRLLGTTELGYYTLAFNLASWPVSFFAVAVARVSVPAFARMQHDTRRLQSAYDNTSLILLAVTVPTCLLLAVFAEPLVLFVYGETWLPAAAVLRFLAFLGLLRVIYQYWADVLVAVGAGKRVLATQVVWIVALIPLMWYAAAWGLVGVGVAQVVVAFLIVGPVYMSCLRGVVRLRPSLVGWLHIIFAGIVASLAGAGIRALGIGPVWTLALGTTALVTTFTLCLWPLAARHGIGPRQGMDTLRRVRSRRTGRRDR